MARDAIPPGPRPGMPVPHLHADMRDIRSLREDLLEVRDEARAHRRETNERLTTVERIARATFEELTGRDAAKIPGVDRDWGRTLRLGGVAVAIVFACFLAACAGVRVGIIPVPQEHHQ